MGFLTVCAKKQGAQELQSGISSRRNLRSRYSKDINNNTSTNLPPQRMDSDAKASLAAVDDGDQDESFDPIE